MLRFWGTRGSSKGGGGGEGCSKNNNIYCETRSNRNQLQLITNIPSFLVERCLSIARLHHVINIIKSSYKSLVSILSQGKNKVFFVHDYNPMSHLIHGPEPERSFQTKMYELLQGVTGNFNWMNSWPLVWLLILPSSCYTINWKLVTRIF